MAKLSTLTDDFQDGVIDASLWATSGTCAETGGRAKLTPTTSFSFWGTPARTYDLTSSQVVAQIPVVTSTGSTGGLQCGIVVDKDSNNLIGMRKVGSQLICTKSVGGIETQLSFTPYSAVNHLFWRIRTDATNVYWETSATGVGAYFTQNTTSIASLGFAINVVGFYFYTGWYSGVEAFPGTFQIESVNPGLNITASGSSTSTGSLALSITGPVQIVFSGASTSTGHLALLTVSPLDLTAYGSSTSTGALAFSIIPAGTVNLSASGASTSTGSLSFGLITPTPGELSAFALSTSSGTLSFIIALPTGPYYFEPPIAYDLPPTLPDPKPRYINAHARWKGGQRRGRSVLKLPATGLFPLATLFPDTDLFPLSHVSYSYVIVDTPTVDQIAAASIAYQGGHVYEVSAEEAALLQMAGFTVT